MIKLSTEGIKAALYASRGLGWESGRYKLETAILAYLPHHESELVKALEEIANYGFVTHGSQSCQNIAKQTLAKYKEGKL